MAGIRQVPSIIQPALSSVWAAESGGYLGSRAASTKASPSPQPGLILTAIWVMRGTRQGAYTRHKYEEFDAGTRNPALVCGRGPVNITSHIDYGGLDKVQIGAFF